MLKKASDFLNGIPMTIVSGVFLLASLALLITKNFMELNISPFLDFAWITVVISGFPLVYLAISRLIKQCWVSSALLITVAMIASICVGEVFAAGEVAFIMALGSILEDKTVERAKKGLNSLIKLSPQTGRIFYEENGKTLEKVVNIDEIESGMKLRVLAGETISVDGKIIVGNTSIDQSIMTGESLPVDKSVGDEVFCGTMNLYGSVDIVATNVKENSSLQKMIKLLKEKLSQTENTVQNVDEFIRNIKKYLEVPELTREMCYELIARVVVGGLSKVTGKERVIEIVYKVDISSVLKHKFIK